MLKRFVDEVVVAMHAWWKYAVTLHAPHGYADAASALGQARRLAALHVKVGEHLRAVERAEILDFNFFSAAGAGRDDRFQDQSTAQLRPGTATQNAESDLDLVEWTREVQRVLRTGLEAGAVQQVLRTFHAAQPRLLALSREHKELQKLWLAVLKQCEVVIGAQRANAFMSTAGSTSISSSGSDTLAPELLQLSVPQLMAVALVNLEQCGTSFNWAPDVAKVVVATTSRSLEWMCMQLLVSCDQIMGDFALRSASASTSSHSGVVSLGLADKSIDIACRLWLGVRVLIEPVFRLLLLLHAHAQAVRLFEKLQVAFIHLVPGLGSSVVATHLELWLLDTALSHPCFSQQRYASKKLVDLILAALQLRSWEFALAIRRKGVLQLDMPLSSMPIDARGDVRTLLDRFLCRVRLAQFLGVLGRRDESLAMHIFDARQGLWMVELLIVCEAWECKPLLALVVRACFAIADPFLDRSDGADDGLQVGRSGGESGRLNLCSSYTAMLLLAAFFEVVLKTARLEATFDVYMECCEQTLDRFGDAAARLFSSRNMYKTLVEVFAATRSLLRSKHAPPPLASHHQQQQQQQQQQGPSHSRAADASRTVRKYGSDSADAKNVGGEAKDQKDEDGYMRIMTLVQRASAVRVEAEVKAGSDGTVETFGGSTDEWLCVCNILLTHWPRLLQHQRFDATARVCSSILMCMDEETHRALIANGNFSPIIRLACRIARELDEPNMGANSPRSSSHASHLLRHSLTPAMQEMYIAALDRLALIMEGAFVTASALVDALRAAQSTCEFAELLTFRYTVSTGMKLFVRIMNEPCPGYGAPAGGALLSSTASRVGADFSYSTAGADAAETNIRTPEIGKGNSPGVHLVRKDTSLMPDGWALSASLGADVDASGAASATEVKGRGHVARSATSAILPTQPLRARAGVSPGQGEILLSTAVAPVDGLPAAVLAGKRAIVLAIVRTLGRLAGQLKLVQQSRRARFALKILSIALAGFCDMVLPSSPKENLRVFKDCMVSREIRSLVTKACVIDRVDGDLNVDSANRALISYSDLESFVSSVIQTLTYIHYGVKGRLDLAIFFQETEFSDEIWCLTGGSVNPNRSFSHKVMDTLFSILVENSRGTLALFEKRSEKTRLSDDEALLWHIRNPSALAMMLRLIRKASYASVDQSRSADSFDADTSLCDVEKVLSAISNLVVACTTNRAACANANLLDVVLEWLEADEGLIRQNEPSDEAQMVALRVVSLMGILVEYSISPPQMMRVLSLLRRGSRSGPNSGARIERRALVTGAVLDILNLSFIEKEGPPAFFDLSGKRSGLTANDMNIALSSSGSRSGYSAALWVRLERTSAHSVLFAIADDAGGLVELALMQNHCLSIRLAQHGAGVVSASHTDSNAPSNASPSDLTRSGTTTRKNFEADRDADGQGSDLLYNVGGIASSVAGQQQRSVPALAGNLKNDVHNTRVQLPDSQWCHILLTHSLSTGGASAFSIPMSSKGTEQKCHIYLNGVCVYAEALRLASSQGHGAKLFGNGLVKAVSFGCTTSGAQCFMGQLGATYVFSDVLNADVAATLASLGPAFDGNLLFPNVPRLLVSPPQQLGENLNNRKRKGALVARAGPIRTMLASSEWNSKVVERVMLLFAPRASNGRICPDNSLGGASGTLLSTFCRIAGPEYATQLCLAQDIRDSFSIAGGISELLPIFACLDALCVQQEGAGKNKPIPESLQVLPKLLHLLGVVVCTDSLYRSTFLHRRGFQMISFILKERCTPRHRTRRVVRAIWDLVDEFCALGSAREHSLLEQTNTGSASVSSSLAGSKEKDTAGSSFLNFQDSSAGLPKTSEMFVMTASLVRALVLDPLMWIAPGVDLSTALQMYAAVLDCLEYPHAGVAPGTNSGAENTSAPSGSGSSVSMGITDDNYASTKRNVIMYCLDVQSIIDLCMELSLPESILSVDTSRSDGSMGSRSEQMELCILLLRITVRAGVLRAKERSLTACNECLRVLFNIFDRASSDMGSSRIEDKSEAQNAQVVATCLLTVLCGDEYYERPQCSNDTLLFFSRGSSKSLFVTLINLFWSPVDKLRLGAIQLACQIEGMSSTGIALSPGTSYNKNRVNVGCSALAALLSHRVNKSACILALEVAFGPTSYSPFVPVVFALLCADREWKLSTSSLRAMTARIKADKSAGVRILSFPTWPQWMQKLCTRDIPTSESSTALAAEFYVALDALLYALLDCAFAEGPTLFLQQVERLLLTADYRLSRRALLVMLDLAQNVFVPLALLSRSGGGGGSHAGGSSIHHPQPEQQKQNAWMACFAGIVLLGEVLLYGRNPEQFDSDLALHLVNTMRIMGVWQRQALQLTLTLSSLKSSFLTSGRVSMDVAVQGINVTCVDAVSSTSSSAASLPAGGQQQLQPQDTGENNSSGVEDHLSRLEHTVEALAALGGFLRPCLRTLCSMVAWAVDEKASAEIARILIEAVKPFGGQPSSSSSKTSSSSSSSSSSAVPGSGQNPLRWQFYLRMTLSRLMDECELKQRSSGIRDHDPAADLPRRAWLEDALQAVEANFKESKKKSKFKLFGLNMAMSGSSGASSDKLEEEADAAARAMLKEQDWTLALGARAEVICAEMEKIEKEQDALKFETGFLLKDSVSKSVDKMLSEEASRLSLSQIKDAMAAAAVEKHWSKLDRALITERLENIDPNSMLWKLDTCEDALGRRFLMQWDTNGVNRAAAAHSPDPDAQAGSSMPSPSPSEITQRAISEIGELQISAPVAVVASGGAVSLAAGSDRRDQNQENLDRFEELVLNEQGNDVPEDELEHQVRSLTRLDSILNRQNAAAQGKKGTVQNTRAARRQFQRFGTAHGTESGGVGSTTALVDASASASASSALNVSTQHEAAAKQIAVAGAAASFSGTTLWSGDAMFMRPTYVCGGRLEMSRHELIFRPLGRSASASSSQKKSNASEPDSSLVGADDERGDGEGADSDDTNMNSAPTSSEKWIDERAFSLHSIAEVLFRRYALQPRAVEIFFSERRSHLQYVYRNHSQSQREIFLVFSSETVQKAFLKALKEQLKRIGNTFGAARVLSSPRHCMDALKPATEAWRAKSMSTFQYLMLVNKYAGRTYNDMSQYPVFPWVLADYSASVLDLASADVFRDLSKPMGCQRSEEEVARGVLESAREQLFRKRYAEWADPSTGIPPFHYGSHYSSPGSVLGFLVRVEPFTELFLRNQGGTFDYADRMFRSVRLAYKSATESTQNVNECIPEFYYQPEVFRNRNRLPLGVLHDGSEVGDVALPPWSLNSPDLFVKMHREALESVHVSSTLHLWIDLVFGVKQRGPLAKEACNVFYYLTYEGTVDLDRIHDPKARSSIEAQIQHFGQTPLQLWSKPHGQRDVSSVDVSGSSVVSTGADRHIQRHVNDDLDWPLAVLDAESVSMQDGIVLLQHVGSYVFTICRSRSLATHRWSPLPDLEGKPYTFEPDCKVVMSGETERATLRSVTGRTRGSSSRVGRRVGGAHVAPVLRDFEMGSLYAITKDGRYVISGGHWDNSVRLSATSEPGRPKQVLYHHRDVVTCVTLSQDGETLVTGARDTLVIVWDMVAAPAKATTTLNSMAAAVVSGPTGSSSPPHGSLPDTGGGSGAGVGLLGSPLVLAVRVGSIDAGASDFKLDGQSERTASLPPSANVMATGLGGAHAKQVVRPEPRFVLRGHKGPVSCVAVHSGIGVIVSGDESGWMLTHSFRKGTLLRAVRDVGVISRCMVSAHAEVLLYARTTRELQIQTINFGLLARVVCDDGLECFAASSDGRFLYTGTQSGRVQIRNRACLNVIHEYAPLEGAVMSVALSTDESVLFAAVTSGRLYVFWLDRERLLSLLAFPTLHGVSHLGTFTA
ncbi:BEACH domain-containing protein lvsC [Porphyridium purpureum]|uniref:BEACH domain-containing protein lvsC n=1 Tax=Porphyridium purpureum TaxID=35688 RepID=A0A5J4YQ64_PORPP|nr:BEACH domain-containing protein lvsC [Porphyridium purpureum]|eukprot:POR3283..scf222_8